MIVTVRLFTDFLRLSLNAKVQFAAGQRSLSKTLVQRLVVVVCEGRSSRCDSQARGLCYGCLSVGQRKNHQSGRVQVRSFVFHMYQ